jgi:hypothetical protein
MMIEYTQEQIETIKQRARRLINGVSHTPTFIDANHLMIEQLLNIVDQYERLKEASDA